MFLVVLQTVAISLLRAHWPASDWKGLFAAIGLVPPLFLPLGVLACGFIARRTKSRLFHRGWRPGWFGLVALLPAVVGLRGSVWCHRNHVCMGGHLDHPPYEAFHLQWDAAWLLCLVLSGALFFVSRSYHALLFVILFTSFTVFRFGLGSMGGMLPYPL
jgi:hypothetical protein